MAIELRDAMKSLERRFGDLSRRVWPLGEGFAMEVYNRNGDLVVHVDAPGMDPDKEIEVSLSDGDLCVRGERHQKEEVKKEDYYRLETSYGSFERHVPVPKSLTDKDIDAHYDDGVLEVVVHGHEEAAASEGTAAEATKIPVNRAT